MNIKAVYNAAKSEFKDIDSWLASAVRIQYGEAADAVSCSILCEDTNEPWEAYRAFEKAAVIINNRDIIPSIIQNLLPREIAYACYVLKKSWPEKQFNDEVTKFIAAYLMENGVVVCPDELTFVQTFIPLTKLTKAQEAFQGEHLQEMLTYLEMMKENDGFTKNGKEVS